MKRPHFLIIAIWLFVSQCTTIESTPQILNNGNDDDTDAPAFSLLSDGGTEVSLADFSGKPLVIFFFGSTCPLCISSAPDIESGITQMFSSNNMAIIGIDTWDGNQASVENFKNTTGVTFDLLLDGSATGSAYATTYDRLVVVNAKGKIVYKGETSASNDVENVASLVAQLIE